MSKRFSFSKHLLKSDCTLIIEKIHGSLNMLHDSGPIRESLEKKIMMCLLLKTIAKKTKFECICCINQTGLRNKKKVENIFNNTLVGGKWCVNWVGFYVKKMNVSGRENDCVALWRMGCVNSHNRSLFQNCIPRSSQFKREKREQCIPGRVVSWSISSQTSQIVLNINNFQIETFQYSDCQQICCFSTAFFAKSIFEIPSICAS